MSAVRRAGLAVWGLIVGDDWRVALGVSAAIAITALVATNSITAWWVLPTAVLALLALVRRARAGR